MYLTFDLASPIQGDYLTNKRIKHRILKHWPRTTVNDNEVFDRLIIYNGSVVESKSHKSLYKLLGTSVDTLKSESYKGVDRVWLELSPEVGNLEQLTNQDVIDYLEAESTLGEVVTVDLVLTQLYTNQNTYNNSSSLDLATLVKTDRSVIKNSETFNYDKSASAVTFMALFDTSDILFNRTVIPQFRTVEVIESHRGHKKYRVTITFTFTFSRKLEASDTLASDLITELVHECQPTTSKLANTSPYASSAYYQQRSAFRTYAINYSSDGLIYYVNTSSTSGFTTQKKSYLLVSGFQAMKLKDIPALLRSSIKTDYREKSADAWAKFATVVLFFVAVILSVPTAGQSVVVFLGALAINLTIAIALGALIVYSLNKNGLYGNAMYFGRMVQFLTRVTTFVGYLSALTGIGAAIQEIRKSIIDNAVKMATERAADEAAQQTATATAYEAVAEATVEVGEPTLSDYVTATLEMVTESISGVFSSSTTEVLTKTTQFLNQAFTVYSNFIAPVKNPGSPPSDEKEPDNVTQIEWIQKDFETYGFIDINERMDAMPHALTQGLVEETFNKYYEG